MNITVLTNVETEGSTAYDSVVPQVAKALETGGHKASILGVYNDVTKLVSTLKRSEPDVIFNLVESFGESLSGDFAVAGLLDLLRHTYTGGGPGELYLRQDKSLAKKILAFHGIRFPDFAVFAEAGSDFETGGNLQMPIFVKPLRSDASIGITTRSLVHTTADMMKRVLAIHKDLHDSALAEEYIEGREFYVGILGNGQPQAFPPIEMDFSGLPEGAPRVLDTKAKWAPNSKEYKGTHSKVAQLPDELRAKLQQVSLEAYRALRVRDYGRVDLRLTDTGEVYVIEVNASCYLEATSEFAMAAEAAGLSYADLINKIVILAQERGKQ